MKKSLLALAVLGTFTGVAFAQSSVTLFGVLDQSANFVKNGTTKTKTIQSNQLNSNRLGFRGTEDLGGGLSAAFHLEAGMSNDDGGVGGGNGLGTVFFNRRSTVSLLGGFGEIRAGRDYVPSFWNFAVYDAFGANGLANGFNMFTTLGSGAVTAARDNNTVAYHLPSNLGGLFGQVTIAPGEGVNGQKYTGVRVGYGAGPFSVAVAHGQTETGVNDFKTTNFGGSWNLGAVTILGYYGQQKFGAAKQKLYDIGVNVPLGQGVLSAAVAKSDLNGANDSTMMGVGYTYNLSKRTALYGTFGNIKNKGSAAFVVLGTAGSAANGKSNGFNVGIKHSF